MEAKQKVPAGAEIIYLGWIMASDKNSVENNELEDYQYEIIFWKYGNYSHNNYAISVAWIYWNFHMEQIEY